MKFIETLGLIKADLRRRLILEGKPLTYLSLICILPKLGVASVVIYRIRRYCHLNNFKVLVKLLSYLEFLYVHNELDVRAEVGPGLVLSDIAGVGITRVCIIGKNCTFAGRATLTIGGIEGVDVNVDRIVIGDNCVVGHNTRIIRPVTISNGVQIKSNSVVLLSVNNEGALVSGIPAKRKELIPLELVSTWSPFLSYFYSPLLLKKKSQMPPKQSIAKTFELIRDDMLFRCEYEHKKLNFIRVLGFLVSYSAFSQILFRFQTFFYTNHMSIVSKFIEWVNGFIFTISIDSAARIDSGLLILHANFIHIGKNVTIGKNCILAHQNLIGPAVTLDSASSDSAQGPVIGDHVFIGGGSTISGNISIGSHSKVGINAAVDASFPDYSVLFGVPARNMTKSTVE